MKEFIIGDMVTVEGVDKLGTVYSGPHYSPTTERKGYNIFYAGHQGTYFVEEDRLTQKFYYINMSDVKGVI